MVNQNSTQSSTHESIFHLSQELECRLRLLHSAEGDACVPRLPQPGALPPQHRTDAKQCPGSLGSEIPLVKI